MSRLRRKKEKAFLADAIAGIDQKLGVLSAGVDALKAEANEAEAFKRRQIDGLKAICRIAWGISTFAKQNLTAIASEKSAAESLCRRLDYLMKSVCEVLSAQGVSVIAPKKHDEVSPTNHRIAGQDDPACEDDAPDTVSECWEIGFIQDDGIVTPAEITVFKQVNN